MAGERGFLNYDLDERNERNERTPNRKTNDPDGHPILCAPGPRRDQGGKNRTSLRDRPCGWFYFGKEGGRSLL